ncbi:MAG: RnfABCDGE type electron transport complex subunit D [Rikenellaceae bacterium]
MINKLVVSPSPHVKGKSDTSTLMRDVVIALVPAFIVSWVFFGANVGIVTATAVISCILFEYCICKFLLKRNNTIKDFSAIVTGVLLAFNLPPEIPLHLVVIGSLVAIGVGKMSFGGLGNNPFNPALVGRVFLLISFPVNMTSFSATSRAIASDVVSSATYDAASGATPLSFMKGAITSGKPVSELMHNFSYSSFLFGDKAGSLGEIAALALLIGFVYLLWRKVITWHIPVFVLGSMAIFSGILWLIDPNTYLSPLFHVLAGGAILGAVFMATDYVTSPMTKSGMLIYGMGIGVITIIVRTWGAYPEGISFAILIMNGVTPLINKYSKPKRFGEKRK